MIELGTGDVPPCNFGISIKKEGKYEVIYFGETTLAEVFIASGLLRYFSNKDTKPCLVVSQSDHDEESLLKLAQEISSLDQENYEEKGD